jgi:hypothetical protein
LRGGWNLRVVDRRCRRLALLLRRLLGGRGGRGLHLALLHGLLGLREGRLRRLRRVRGLGRACGLRSGGSGWAG